MSVFTIRERGQPHPHTSISAAVVVAEPSDYADHAYGADIAAGESVRPAPAQSPVAEWWATPAPTRGGERLSRLTNIAFAILGLILTLPLLITLALLIRLDSPGPVVHTQIRVGVDRRWRSFRAIHEARRKDLGGRPFTIYKLRTMREGAEDASGAVWASRGDPRVTRVGRFLRKYRLDEIPQLWNVIRGDMNIVGPRPERPTIVAQLREDIPEYQLRHRVKPGITGLAQINQSYDASLDDVRAKVAWDLSYIQSQSLWLDIRVMALTIPTVLLKMRGW